MSKSQSIIKNAIKFTASGYISSVCNFISAIVVRRILNPFFMGVYTQLLLVFEYAKYSHLGMINSLDRQIPYYNGKGDFEKVGEAKNIGMTFSLASSLLAAVAILIYSYALGDRLAPALSMGLKIISIMVVMQSMSSFYVTLSRTHHLFNHLSKYIIMVAFFDIFLKAALGIKFGVIGILWATVLTLSIGLFYLIKSTGLKCRLIFKIPIRNIIALLNIGFPLLLAGFTFMALRSVDRIMIIALLSKTELGYYSIAIMMHSFIFQFPNLMYTVLFPHFYEAFGNSDDDVKKVEGYLYKPSLAFAYIFPIIIGVSVIILPAFVAYLLPKYTSGITPAVILLFGTFFVSITNMSEFLLVALKRQKILILIGVICVLISIFLNFIFIKILAMGIKGAALGTAITYFLYSLFLISSAVRYYISGIKGRIKFFFNLYAPIAWVMLIFYSCGFIFKYRFQNLAADAGSIFLQVAIFLTLTAPLLILANKKVDLFRRIANVKFNFIKK